MESEKVINANNMPVTAPMKEENLDVVNDRQTR